MTTFRETQVWNADDYERDGRFVADLATAVVDLLAVKSGERILDIGCGDGHLTAQLMAAGATLIGTDASPEMIAAAAARGVDAHVIDAQALSFDTEFDAVFSNAALHWMPDADAVIAGVFRSLKPGGRFVAEMGGFGNIAALRTAARAAHRIVTGRDMPDDRKYFPTPEDYGARLERAGFSVHEIALYPRQTPLTENGIRGWYETFGGRYFDGLEADQQVAVIDQAEVLLRPDLMTGTGQWVADYVRLRFKAVKSE